jgi:hypothetical protein
VGRASSDEVEFEAREEYRDDRTVDGEPSGESSEGREGDWKSDVEFRDGVGG